MTGLFANTMYRPPVKDSANVTIKLKHKSFLPTDPCFGVAKHTIAYLVSQCEGREGQ